MSPINKGIQFFVAGVFALITVTSAAESHKFEMTVEEVTLSIAPGFTSKVWAYDGQVPGPLLRVKEGDEVELTLINNTTLNHTIHWHGFYQTGSWQSDGVPDITQKAVEPGESFTYRFIADKKGSLWYHCHVNVAEHVGTRGMWGAFIVDPLEPTPLEQSVSKDAVLMFSGWNPDVADVYGEGGHPDESISYFSINGKSFPNTQPLRVKEGDVLRLRLFAATIPVAFHLHGHDVLVTHKDGLPLDTPVAMDVVPMQPGERYDVIVEMNNPGRWIAHDHHEHHTTNNGKMPGGAVMVLEYENIPADEWYIWAKKDYDPNFYWSESLQSGESGIFRHDNFLGEFEDFRR
jgi:FtsP/CotA-like multicopper oxidase with cupredoxin domain